MLSEQRDRPLFRPASRMGPDLGEPSWYAIHTMARHEKRVAAQLHDKRVSVFLPLLQQLHRWTDRQTKVEVPLFSCYAFVRIHATAENRVEVLRTPGVIGFVGNDRQGTPIADQEIENLRTAIREKVPFVAHPFLTTGKLIRIRGGALDGLEGIVTGTGVDQSLVLSVKLLQRSVCIRIQGYKVDLI